VTGLSLPILMAAITFHSKPSYQSVLVSAKTAPLPKYKTAKFPKSQNL